MIQAFENTRLKTCIQEISSENISHLERFQVEGTNKNIQFAHFLCSGDQKIEEYLFSSMFHRWYSRMSRFIPEGSTVLDFGASTGDTSIPMAFAAGKSGKCYCFEPGTTFSQLSINKAINPDLNLLIYNVAATDKDGIDLFNYKGDNGGHIHKTSYVGDFPNKRTVATIDILSFLDKEKIDNLSFIKLDTEGFDMEILRFIDFYIDKHRPVIHIEWFPYTTKAMFDFVIKKNYYSVDFETFKPYDTIPDSWRMDILLIPKEK